MKDTLREGAAIQALHDHSRKHIGCLQHVFAQQKVALTGAPVFRIDGCGGDRRLVVNDNVKSYVITYEKRVSAFVIRNRSQAT